MVRDSPYRDPVSNSERLIESTRAAEGLGYDAIFIVDHIHNSFERHKQYPVGTRK
jgi:alkanesulfonate monooxygenase SsuD/methylene tetrahydromethanopterin reductase-like flavin-dependent oxidoreductase (luciferase family)